MNAQLPPIDSKIREHLARRSAGRLPDGLVVDVFAALDSRPPRRTIWRVPRLAVASISLAIVAVLAVTIAFSASRPAPAATTPSLNGYPAERALTTPELALLMAGPALPVNTAFVASVTIDVRNDVCPMNRYQTQGVVEGMGSQVCVMTADVAVQPMTLTGTFAMRYLAPGYLLLVGALTPASTSGLAFRVADDWPLAGKTFLTQGWLYYTGLIGNDPSVCSQASPDTNGTYSCTVSWMSDSPNATAVHDANGLPGPPNGVPARSVGMTPDVADMDQITSGRTSGIFVVASVTGPCPGAEPQDSRGCPAWRVLAKVADITLPAPNRSAASDAPTTAPPASPIASPLARIAVAPTGLIGPNNRALTPAELSALIAADPNNLAGRYVIDMRVTCDGVDCSGLPPKAIADQIQPGSIGLVGPVDLRPDGGLVWTVPQSLNGFQGRFIFIVDAWIGGGGLGDACDILGQPCDRSTRLGSGPNARELTAQPGAISQFAPPNTPVGSAVRGLFLVSRVDNGKVCGMAPLASDGQCSAQIEILARLEPAVLP